VLASFSPPQMIEALSARIDPRTDTGLGYYPLARKGERFPVNDPEMHPRIEPRPADDALFLKGLFEGIAEIERLAYRRLHELGAPKIVSIRSVGGGAGNSNWTTIRTRKLGVPSKPVLSIEAAFGCALLAQNAVNSGDGA